LKSENITEGRSMPYELPSRPAPCSRRSLLLAAGAAAAAAATGVAAPAEAVAAMKISEAAVAYQDHPNGDKECSKCLQFLPPSSCRMVDGTISPHGYCRIFALRQSAAVRISPSPVRG
jgi:hypothetical protein